MAPRTDLPWLALHRVYRIERSSCGRAAHLPRRAVTGLRIPPFEKPAKGAGLYKMPRASEREIPRSEALVGEQTRSV